MINRCICTRITAADGVHRGSFELLLSRSDFTRFSNELLVIDCFFLVADKKTPGSFASRLPLPLPARCKFFSFHRKLIHSLPISRSFAPSFVRMLQSFALLELWPFLSLRRLPSRIFFRVFSPTRPTVSLPLYRLGGKYFSKSNRPSVRSGDTRKQRSILRFQTVRRVRSTGMMKPMQRHVPSCG